MPMASILEQYESMNQQQQQSSQNPRPGSLSGGSPFSNASASINRNEGIINLRSESMEPIFTKNRIDFKPSHPITHLVVSNNQLLLAMENFHLLKIDLANPTKPLDIDLNPHLTSIKPPYKPTINDLFIDPSGGHCLISVGCRTLAADGSGGHDNDKNLMPFENFYLYRKLSLLTKLKGYIVTAIGWTSFLEQQNLSGSLKTCPNFLIGTIDGRVFETHLQSDDRFLASSRELTFCKLVCDLSATVATAATANLDQDSKPPQSVDVKERICAIHCFQLKSCANGFCVLIATRNFFYQYLGQIPNNQPLSQLDGMPYLYQIIQNSSQKAFKEMPGYILQSRLDLFYPTTGPYRFPLSFGWLTKPGIFFGQIPKDLHPDKDGRILDDASIIMYNDLNQNSNKSSSSPSNFDSIEIPMSFVLTRFHLLLQYASRIKMVCFLNQEVVVEDRFLSEPGEGIIKDPIKNTIWSYTKHTVYRYKITQEDRDIWEIYLKKKDFESARKYAANDVIKMDRTLWEEALYYFERKDYKRSALLFTRTKSKTFEEIALKFIELRDKNQEALKEFLLNKLSALSVVKDQTQMSMLLLWLFEIMLNQLALLDNSIKDSLIYQQEVSILKIEYNRIEKSLKELISNSNYKTIYRNIRRIVYDLMKNHRNNQFYEYFAQEIDDFECLVEYYCKQGEYNRAMSLLKQEECLNLYYRYSPLLIQHLPEQLIDSLIPLAGEIDFGKLIPALAHFDYSSDNNGKTVHHDRQCQEILRFLEYCVYELQTQNSLVHNYLLALLAQYQPEKLLKYLDIVSNDDMGVKSPYDLRYATQICMQNKVPHKVIVQLLTTMGGYEEAVEQALSANDVDLAKKIAEKVQNSMLNDSMTPAGQPSQDLAKRLWLKIGKHVINNIYKSSSEDQGENESITLDISMATSILNECSLLKIEDILPYFPEYLTIDYFKDAIYQTLEEYNRNIESLREDMVLATDSAQQIREEISKVRNRFTVIDHTDLCMICSFPALQEYFYSFPSCGHLFHHKCLAKEILEYLSDNDRIELEGMIAETRSIQNQLHSLMMTGPTGHKVNSPDQSTGTETSLSLTNRLESLTAKIEELIASECLLCGNFMIQTIDKPFIDPIRDREEMIGWN